MKIYARLHNSTRKVEGMGDDTRIMIELTYKNQVLGTLGFYTIFGGSSQKGIGARVIWKSENTPTIGTIVEEYTARDEQGNITTKGKKQKGETKDRIAYLYSHIEWEHVSLDAIEKYGTDELSQLSASQLTELSNLYDY